MINRLVLLRTSQIITVLHVDGFTKELRIVVLRIMYILPCSCLHLHFHYTPWYSFHCTLVVVVILVNETWS